MGCVHNRNIRSMSSWDDFLYHHGVDIKLSTHSIKIAGEEIFASLVKTSGASIRVSQVTLDKCTVVPPNSIKFIKGTSQHNLSGKVILQPVNKHTHVLMPSVAVEIQDREVPVQLTDPTDSFVTLRKGYDIGYLEEVAEIFEDPDEVIVDEKSADSSEKDATKFSAGEQSARSKIRRCTMSTEEMPGTTEDPLTKLKVVNEGTSKQPEEAKDKHTKPDKDEESLHRELEEAVQAEHVQDLYKQSTTHLDLSECIILAKFIKEFQDIFATSDDDLGCCTVIEHEIDTEDVKPVHQQMRHISKEFEGEAEKCIQKMWDNNTIQPSNSEWAS